MNILNKAVLLDAQKHPDKHRDLIVRVWAGAVTSLNLTKYFRIILSDALPTENKIR